MTWEGSERKRPWTSLNYLNTYLQWSSAEARIRVQVSPSGIYGWQNGTGTDFLRQLFHIHSYIIWGMAVSPSAAQFNEDVASLTRQKQQRSSVQVGSRYIQKEIQVLYRYC